MKKIFICLLVVIIGLFILCGFVFTPKESSFTFIIEGKEEIKITTKISFFDSVLLKYTNRKDVFVMLNIDENNLDKMLSKYEYGSLNAYLKYDKNGKFSYTKESYGRKINREKLKADLVRAIKKDEKKVVVFVEKIKPKITIDILKEQTQKLGEFSTSYENSSVERKKNIKIATEYLSGSIIEAGKELSFNKLVGERTLERGFVTAKVIFEGEFVDGIGGGVCQVSTTLYNAWINAGLAVVRAKNHSKQVGYVNIFSDCAVSQYSDMVLKNDNDTPIYIYGLATDEETKFVLYGKPNGEAVKIVNKLKKVVENKEYNLTDSYVKWEENELERILKSPTPHIIGEQIREFYKDNKLIRAEKLRSCYYLGDKGVKVKNPLFSEKRKPIILKTLIKEQ